MKKSEKQAIGRSLLNTGLSFAKGLVSGINPIVGAGIGAIEGAVKGIQKEKEKNLDSKVGGVGKVDISHLAGVGVFVFLTVCFIMGWITIEDLKDLLKFFVNNLAE